MEPEQTRVQEALKSKRKFSKVTGYSLGTINKMIAKGQLETKMVGDSERILYEIYKKDIGITD